MFISDNHEWGSNLKVGDTVYVALPNKETVAITGCQAVVRWIGTLPGETGTKFGIEITVRLFTVSRYHQGHTKRERACKLAIKN